MQIIFLCTLLPVTHKFLTNRFETKKADLMMAKISIVFDFLSPLIFGLSAKPAGAWVGESVASVYVGASS
jgi:ABC-type transport system involved in cytochrome c biogenesis permease subunit